MRFRRIFFNFIGINALCLFKWVPLNPQTSGRALQDPQHDQLVTACAACALPLFVKLSYDSAVRWRSYQPVEECILGQAVEDSIELLFDRVEKYHGEVLVQHALGYVTAAKSGLRYCNLINWIASDFYKLECKLMTWRRLVSVASFFKTSHKSMLNLSQYRMI